MLHARVVRPPSYGAKLVSVDTAGIEGLDGARVVREGDFLAVVAPREWHAIRAMNRLERARALAGERGAAGREGAHALRARAPRARHRDPPKGVPGGGARTVEATYSRPYLAHGSIGPACAVAQVTGDALTVWTHTQGVYPDRKAIAEMLGMPEAKVRCIHVEGAGCYGHNGADDAAADAALLATRFPGRAVRVQWMREQEHGWEPFGPAMVAKARASLDASGHIADWDYGVWSNTHSMRPGTGGSLLAGQHAKGLVPPPPKPIPMPEGGGDRNSIPIYAVANAKVTSYFIERMPVRVSALRSLGAHLNVFAIESFMDELALAAGTDPVEFRLRHLDDDRAHARWCGRRRSASAGRLAPSRRPGAARASPSRATRTLPRTAPWRARWMWISIPATRR